MWGGGRLWSLQAQRRLLPHLEKGAVVVMVEVTLTTPSLPTSRCTADGLFVVPRPASALTATPPPLPVGFEAARVFYRLGLLRVNNRPAGLML